MDWINRLKSALDFIEENLETGLSFDRIAARANTTSFHFQRMFSMLSGITLGEYIRRRKLSLAAQILATTESRILDVAVRFGYESQASFTRAFTKLHGFPPGAIRGNVRQIKAYPPLSLQFSIKGAESMDYTVKKIGPLRLVGKSMRVSTKDGENFRRIPAFWREVMKDGSFETITSFADLKGILAGAPLGVCLDYSEDQNELTYMVAVESKQENLPESIHERLIPETDWAVFNGSGQLPDSIQNLVKRIYSEWFPATGFEHTGGPEMEVYLPPDEGEKECSKFKIMIPVRIAS